MDQFESPRMTSFHELVSKMLGELAAANVEPTIQQKHVRSVVYVRESMVPVAQGLHGFGMEFIKLALTALAKEDWHESNTFTNSRGGRVFAPVACYHGEFEPEELCISSSAFECFSFRVGKKREILDNEQWYLVIIPLYANLPIETSAHLVVRKMHGMNKYTASRFFSDLPTQWFTNEITKTVPYTESNNV